VLANLHFPGEVTAVHVDHGLRVGSAQEAVTIAAQMDTIGVGFESIKVVVEAGPNLEARARDARYGALGPGICVGHTADDLAETMVANMLRGAGSDGLRPMHGQGRYRPIIGLRRSDTEAICASMGWTPLNDPMNADPRFLRARIRHEVLPLLVEVAQRDVVPVLNRMGDLLEDDFSLLNHLAAAIDPTDAHAVAGAPVALSRRAIRSWVTVAGVDPHGHPPSLASVERVLAVARGEAIACEVGFGWRVSRTHQRLRLHRS
jgi:tRNA(Ile)-lysidine synthase